LTGLSLFPGGLAPWSGITRQGNMRKNPASWYIRLRSTVLILARKLCQFDTLEKFSRRAFTSEINTDHNFGGYWFIDNG
jgi:hypothetical protein